MAVVEPQSDHGESHIFESFRIGLGEIVLEDLLAQVGIRGKPLQVTTRSTHFVEVEIIFLLAEYFEHSCSHLVWKTELKVNCLARRDICCPTMAYVHELGNP